MAELGSKGVTAGKIASNVQKKLTRAQEKVGGKGRDGALLPPPPPRDAGGDAGSGGDTPPAAEMRLAGGTAAPAAGWQLPPLPAGLGPLCILSTQNTAAVSRAGFPSVCTLRMSRNMASDSAGRGEGGQRAARLLEICRCLLSQQEPFCPRVQVVLYATVFSRAVFCRSAERVISETVRKGRCVLAFSSSNSVAWQWPLALLTLSSRFWNGGKAKATRSVEIVPVSAEGGVFFECRGPFHCSPPTPVPAEGARNI